MKIIELMKIYNKKLLLIINAVIYKYGFMF